MTIGIQLRDGRVFESFDEYVSFNLNGRKISAEDSLLYYLEFRALLEKDMVEEAFWLEKEKGLPQTMLNSEISKRILKLHSEEGYPAAISYMGKFSQRGFSKESYYTLRGIYDKMLKYKRGKYKRQRREK